MANDPWQRLQRLHGELGITDIGFHTKDMFAEFAGLSSEAEIERKILEIQSRNIGELKLLLYQCSAYFIAHFAEKLKGLNGESSALLLDEPNEFSHNPPELDESGFSESLERIAKSIPFHGLLLLSDTLQASCRNTALFFIRRILKKNNLTPEGEEKLFIYSKILELKTKLNLPSSDKNNNPEVDLITGFNSQNSNFWDGLKIILYLFRERFPGCILETGNFHRLATGLHSIGVKRAYTHQDLSQIPLGPEIIGIYELEGDSPEVCKLSLKPDSVPNSDEIRFDINYDIPRVGCPVIFSRVGDQKEKARDLINAWLMRVANKYYFPLVEKYQQ